MSEFQDRFEEVLTLLGEVPVARVAVRARVLFRGLEDDPAQRAAFRDYLRFAAKCLRQAPRTADDVRTAEAIMRSGLVIHDAETGAVIGAREPTEPRRTIDDVLSESRADLVKAEAAEALAQLFEEPEPQP